MQLRLADHACVHSAASTLELAPRDAALLAWLALEGPTPRVRLAGLLWPDSEPEAARNALRQRLFQLKRQLGVELVTGQAILALAEGVRHDLQDSDSVLGHALHDHSAEFAAWLAQQRERRVARARAGLIELADMAERSHDLADALSHALELLALEPLSEAAHRRVMRLQYLRGDSAAALLAFDHCERMLKHEVGAKPSAETLALLRTIETAAAPGPGLPALARIPASVLRPPRLVGRERELRLLAEGWQSGQVVALIGEAGLGKTRLLQEFMAQRPGIVRAAGRPGDAGVPFATLARLLREVLALDDAQAAPVLAPAARGALARVLPEFDVLVPPRAGGEGQRLVLQRALRALLAERPGLRGLVVDDLHFADAASLEMIAALIDHEDEAAAVRLPWALAYRPAEAASPVQALHDGLVEQARLVPLPIAPLDVPALAALVDSLALPGVSGAALAAGLARRTGGNPLFVLETLKQAWVEQTLAQLTDARDLPRSPSVSRLIERRVGQLSPAALALARVASIAGVDFDIALAEHVLGVSAMQLADALNELEAAQVLRDTQFAHDLVYDAVRASVPASIARHAHAAVAAWLEPRGSEPARIAQHWIDAGQAQRALPWLGRAADAAGAAVRRKEQIAFLERRSAIETEGGDRGAAFASLLKAAELQVTLDAEGAGLAQCDRLDALADSPEQRIRARVQRAHLTMMRGDAAGAEQLAAQALRDALHGGIDAALVIECRHHLATALALQSRSAEALPQFEASISWTDEHGDDDRRCELRGNLALTLDNLGRLADAVPHHENAISLAQRLAHHGNLAMCLNNYAANRILGGHLGDGEALLRRAAQVRAQADDSSSIEGFGAMLQAICDYQRGRYGAALQALSASEEQLARHAPGFGPFARLHLAVCWAQLGQWSRLQQTLARIGPDMAVSTAARTSLLQYQMARALRGPHADPAALHTALQRLGDEAPDMRHMVEIELAATLEPEPALQRLESVIAAAQRLGHDGSVIAARALAAWRAAQAGLAARARELARSALALAECSQPVRQYPAEFWLHCGLAFAQIGDGPAAAAAFGAGRDWVRRIADEHVPGEFRDGFLHRNPVNRELQALAGRWATT